MDIAMPEGTTIIAAREGVVVKTENSQSGRAPNPSGNFVRILHPDGTMGVYLHLMRGSVVVAEGATGTPGADAGQVGQYRQQHRPAPAFRGAAQCGVGAGVDTLPVRPADQRVARLYCG
nr:peptidoglycan DD-metalloendopeptidase family protein [Pseudomonas putida]